VGAGSGGAAEASAWSRGPGSAAAFTTSTGSRAESRTASGAGASRQTRIASARASIASKGTAAARRQRSQRVEAPKASAGTGRTSVSGRRSRQPASSAITSARLIGDRPPWRSSLDLEHGESSAEAGLLSTTPQPLGGGTRQAIPVAHLVPLLLVLDHERQEQHRLRGLAPQVRLLLAGRRGDLDAPAAVGSHLG